MPDLVHEARRVEVDALVDDLIVFEEKHRDDRDTKRLACGRQPVELAEVGAEQFELGDHGVVGEVEPDVVVALIGEGRARAAVVAHDLVVSVEDLARRHDFIARVAVERGECAVELLLGLRYEVLAHNPLATLT